MELKRPRTESHDSSVQPFKKIMLFGITIEAPVSSLESDRQSPSKHLEVFDEKSLSFTEGEWENAVSELAKHRVEGIILVSDADNMFSILFSTNSQC